MLPQGRMLAVRIQNGGSHQKLQSVREDSPLGPSEEVNDPQQGTRLSHAANTYILDFWLPESERLNFCCFKLPGLW